MERGLNAFTEKAYRNQLAWNGITERISLASSLTAQLDGPAFIAAKAFGVVAGEVAKVALAAAAVGVAFTAAMVKANAEVELLEMRFSTAFKNKDLGAEATKMVRQFAAESGLSLHSVGKAFLEIKNAGIDPTRGAMTAMLNATVAYGGSSQSLELVARAFRQIGGVAKLQAQEVNQLAEHIPQVSRIIAREMGIPYENFRSEMKKGAIDSQAALEALIRGFQKEFDGAMEERKKTFTGMVDTMKFEWQNFLIEVGKTGAFDFVKSAMIELTETIKNLRESGDLRGWANSIAGVFKGVAYGALKAAEAYARVAVELGKLDAKYSLFGGSEENKRELVRSKGALANIRRLQIPLMDDDQLVELVRTNAGEGENAELVAAAVAESRRRQMRPIWDAIKSDIAFPSPPPRKPKDDEKEDKKLWAGYDADWPAEVKRRWPLRLANEALQVPIELDFEQNGLEEIRKQIDQARKDQAAWALAVSDALKDVRPPAFLEELQPGGAFGIGQEPTLSDFGYTPYPNAVRQSPWTWDEIAERARIERDQIGYGPEAGLPDTIGGRFWESTSGPTTTQYGDMADWRQFVADTALSDQVMQRWEQRQKAMEAIDKATGTGAKRTTRRTSEPV
jgi:tape measure domain-containing protein